MRRRLRATFAALSVRNFRLFVVGQLVSNVGTWMQKLAQGWLILDLTGSGTWLGAIVAVQHLPTLVIGPFAGVLADRHGRRAILLLTGTAGAIPALVLGVLTLTDRASIQLVFILALVVGLLDALETPARQALPSDLVPIRLLSNAVTLSNVVQNMGKAVGPAIAGVLISVVGLPLTFLVNSVSFLAVVCALLLMSPEAFVNRHRVVRARGQVREGLRHVRSTPELFGPMMLLAVAGLLALNFQVLLLLLARTTFGGGSAEAGYLLAALGAGSVVGGLVLAGVLRATRSRIIYAALVLSALFVLTGLAPSYWSALCLVFVLGSATVAFKTLVSTWLQLRSGPEMRGRVMSLLVVCSAGMSPLGAPLMGWAASTFGTRATFIVIGVCVAAAAVVCRAYLGAARSSAEDSVRRTKACAVQEVKEM
ncbi:conserved membrane hypothetical protein [metagenome]|uniref:Major facilitator superfamily (MFS) profile domain-containing protein n=1 Tax=metagenome TaxID=256318 RepID=A0A2P2C937_9ZZZZ